MDYVGLLDYVDDSSHYLRRFPVTWGVLRVIESAQMRIGAAGRSYILQNVDLP